MQPPPAAEIRDTEFTEALGSRYLSYALSTIMARSLPDVRDGLKPVHRRLLFAMRALGLSARTGPKKSARVVGDVIGKFHPHGDVAVYEALVRLAQDFSQRYPLVDGQGNFGNIDGDNAAAMRYTEARLTEVAEALLAGIDEDAVDFRTTYDGEGEEPVVLPAAFPNLLANGATGIAVGMATAIPPHNAGELCAALLHLIKKPEAEIGELVRLVPGPDFPTGGVLIEPPDSILDAYRTGRGGFRLRAVWETEKLKNGTWQAVVTEIPYQVQKAKLIERIAELITEKRLTLLDDVRDESTESVRIVLIPKTRNLEPAHLMEALFKQSDLEVRISLNLNVLDGSGVPRVMNLKEALVAFLEHRHQVLIRRSAFRLAEIERRLEVLAGYLIAFLNLDEVIRIIRDEDEPKPVLMARFALSDVQAEAILNLRLRSLRRLEEMELRGEHDKLSAEGADLRALLADESKRMQTLAREISETRKKFGENTLLGRRRTRIDSAPAALDIPAEVLVEREPLTVLLSQKGWIRALKGHDLDLGDIKYKDGDGPGFALTCESIDKLSLFSSDGRFFTLAPDKLPRGRGFGEPVRLSHDLGNEAELLALFVHRPDGRLLLASSDGRGFVVAEPDTLAQTRAGKQVLLLGDEGARAKLCLPVAGDHLATLGDNRKLLIFPLSEIPDMTRGRGVLLQRYGDGGLADARMLTLAEGLTFPYGGKTRTVTDLTPWMGKRAGTGRLAPPGFPRNNRFGG